MRIEREGLTFSQDRARQYHQPPARAGRRPRQQTGRCGLLRREDHRLLRQPHVARRRAHDAPDEQVEQDEEADLQEQECRLDLRRTQWHYVVSRVKVISVEPIVKRVPSSSFTRLTRLPCTST